MEQVSIIGVDPAKNVFQLHGAAADGAIVFRKRLSRPQFARFMAQQRSCLVAMEACASAHHWAREMARHGHEVRLIAPHYVRPFLKRQKNDAADAEAIVEAALRPTMRFVEPKTADQQARAVAFRTREQLVKQRTEAVNAHRSHLYEFGHIAPVGIGYVPRLKRVVEDPEAGIPDLARDICRMLLEQIAQLTDRINMLKARIAAMSNEAEMPRRLQTMPGVGPITALAVETFAPPMEQFRRGRDFAASCWKHAFGVTPGLVPRQHSSDDKQKPGKTSKPLVTFRSEMHCRSVDGAARHPAIAGDRGDGGDPLGPETRGAEGVLVGPDAGTQAGPGRRGRAGEHPSHTCKHVLPGNGWRGASGRC